jgi:signal transduction histidine kinase
LISLFDRTHQHVIAEATPSLDLFGGGFQNVKERLLLGCCLFPKEKGICQHVERLQSGETAEQDEFLGQDACVVLDARENEQVSAKDLIEPLADMRFFAAVPIVSPRGLTIGAYCVLDREPRTTSPDRNQLKFMKDMAVTVMAHLAQGHAASRNRHAERMIVGLGSFVEGRATLRDSWHEANAQYSASEQTGETKEGQLNIQQQHLQQSAEQNVDKRLAFWERTTTDQKDTEPKGSNKVQGDGKDTKAVRNVVAGGNLHDNTLANSVKLVFSRAANLIRESIGAEGVMFLDAHSERFGHLVRHNSRKVSGPTPNDPTSSEEDSTDSAGSTRRSVSDGESESTLVSQCLGFSSSSVSSINEATSTGQAVAVPETLFSSLIRRYPRGKIFSYNADGSVSEDSDSPGDQGEPDTPTTKHRTLSKRRRRPIFQQDAHSLIKIFAGARNILLLPIWDSDKSRWYAGTIVWTNNPEHVFTPDNELVYISAFTNSIMAEIRRVDVELAERAKTNLVSSITHELRNPLHGILGTADILSDTAMNALQHGMVHTIESCGRTLLDTINNLLDLTFIDKYKKKVLRRKKRGSSQRTSSANSGDSTQLQSKRRGENFSSTHVELDAVLEEVAECVFAGYSFYTNPRAPPPAMTDSSPRWADPIKDHEPAGPRSNQVTIIFDIQPGTEWSFHTHAGAWRRILMNVFGNALKYTPSGYIYLGLSSVQRHSKSTKDGHEQQDNQCEVTLTVKDTGKGISSKYLQDGLFTAFSQEDPLASGSGLGLSIVRQAVGFLGGSIEVESTQGVGTTLSICTPLILSTETSGTASSSSMFRSLRSYTQDKRIGFLGFGSSLQSQRDISLYSSLERLCRDWFGLTASNVSPVPSEHQEYDFYLAVQTELDSEDPQRRDLFGLSQRLVTKDGRCAPVVVICQCPEEAHRMFIAAKNRNETFYFEFISQPCGPRKLARALDICIRRQAEEHSGHLTPDEPTHWVEVPESSHLPVDIDASDPPKDRMRISKRPTVDTMGSPQEGGQSVSYARSKPQSSEEVIHPVSPKEVDGVSEPSMPSVLLVDDNDLNLQLLCAYAKKDNCDYLTARNGAEAVETYKAHPGRFRVVVIGTRLISVHNHFPGC